MKKIIVCLVSVLILLSLSACGSKSKEKNNSTFTGEVFQTGTECSDFEGTWKWEQTDTKYQVDGKNSYKIYTFNSDGTYVYAWEYVDMTPYTERKGTFKIDKENCILKTTTDSKLYSSGDSATGTTRFDYKFNEDKTELTLHDVDYPVGENEIVFIKQ